MISTVIARQAPVEEFLPRIGRPGTAACPSSATAARTAPSGAVRPEPECWGRSTFPRRGAWFPQLRLVALVECGSLALLGAAHDLIAVGEREPAERTLGSLAPGMLVPADRGFPSYERYTKAAATGARVRNAMNCIGCNGSQLLTADVSADQSPWRVNCRGSLA
ncbi:hypothetical protein [Streptomyces sp. NPDC001492]